MKKRRTTDAEQLPAEILHTRPVHSLCLTIGQWGHWFSLQQTQLIIAEALNYCVYHEKLHIKGYLITKRTVCLVLQITRADMGRVLAIFYDRVENQIDHHFNHNHSLHPQNIVKPVPLFRQHQLVNHNLIMLITGHKIILPYYSAPVEKLKDMVNSSKFCSAINYSGAKGPVILKHDNLV